MKKISTFKLILLLIITIFLITFIIWNYLAPDYLPNTSSVGSESQYKPYEQPDLVRNPTEAEEEELFKNLPK